MTNKCIHLVPAFGRDYATKRSILKDFHRGMDFKIQDTNCPDNGRLANMRDLKPAYSQFSLSYDKGRKETLVKIKTII